MPKSRAWIPNSQNRYLPDFIVKSSRAIDVGIDTVGCSDEPVDTKHALDFISTEAGKFLSNDVVSLDSNNEIEKATITVHESPTISLIFDRNNDMFDDSEDEEFEFSRNIHVDEKIKPLHAIVRDPTAKSTTVAIADTCPTVREEYMAPLLTPLSPLYSCSISS